MKSVVVRDGPLAGVRIPTFAVNDNEELVDRSGFKQVGRGNSARTFPRPRQATFGDFVEETLEGN